MESRPAGKSSALSSSHLSRKRSKKSSSLKKNDDISNSRPSKSDLKSSNNDIAYQGQKQRQIRSRSPSKSRIHRDEGNHSNSAPKHVKDTKINWRNERAELYGYRLKSKGHKDGHGENLCTLKPDRKQVKDTKINWKHERAELYVSREHIGNRRDLDGDVMRGDKMKQTKIKASVIRPHQRMVKCLNRDDVEVKQLGSNKVRIQLLHYLIAQVIL